MSNKLVVNLMEESEELLFPIRNFEVKGFNCETEKVLRRLINNIETIDEGLRCFTSVNWKPYKKEFLRGITCSGRILELVGGKFKANFVTYDKKGSFFFAMEVLMNIQGLKGKISIFNVSGNLICGDLTKMKILRVETKTGIRPVLVSFAS